MIAATTLDTPDGAFTLVADDGTVLASGWTDDVDALVGLVHPDLRPTAVTEVDPGHAAVSGPAAAVAAYYAGDLDAVGRVAVVQRSGPFREHAWQVLRQVSPGAPVTYAEYADRAGRPAAVRAAAGACAHNAAALFVPCHRVLRSDGTTGGFRYGPAVKESLLARERSAAG
ncbi:MULTISPECIES: methylated-DNA--[protein]-cysteine S-methyltransferase [unclassified Isoptericola]|uniref:methylated-DNA--[protein]-cysteine S-methyltransferase n=1 Tax=unclassified Isoptericola TaxID=2623355 RepID=UPI002714306F|nr:MULTISPECIES: methylated-DNA--[protein]-cysteine S-methyltransferase [unclassified Isoptericola]MDO8143487.1 methylated-DNA--[protein]-cysteine S-methyltransferase [Isoptericola sp. 178]MDO8147348.1 methylated-DNA--[protein]-cysteine S-methyltransferase [Isoptericola sp. b515]